MNRIDYLRDWLRYVPFVVGAAVLVGVAVFGKDATTEDRLAGGLALVLLGAPLIAPSMLRAEKDQTSAMRVVVYIIVSVFSVLTFRLGWKATTLAELKIDPWWTGVVAAALGSKAAQSFSEPPAGGTTTTGDAKTADPSTARLPAPPPLPPRPPTGG
jgi:hypothetical protein